MTARPTKEQCDCGSLSMALKDHAPWCLLQPARVRQPELERREALTSNPRSFLAELLRDALDPRMSNDCLGIHVRGGLEKLRALIRQEQSNDSAPVRDRQRDSVPAVDSPNRLGILARSGYVTSGPHLSGYRLTLGFETLAEVSEAHQAIADLKIGAVETSQPLVSWRLTDEHINSLQVASVDRLIKRAKAAHYVNVRVRINGDWEEHEADWIKHMKREGLTAPSPAPRDQLLRDAIDMCEGWSAHVGGIGQDTIAALREWLSELSAPTHAIGLPVGELTAEMLQIMKDNSDQIEQMRPEEPTEPYHGIGCAVRRGGSCNCAAEGKPENGAGEPSTQCGACGLNHGACMC